jgi:hypothetical protein
MKKTGAFRSWVAMLARVERDPRYSTIQVCPEWLSFDNFLRDMGDRPSGFSIDRIDGSKGYSKENCRWADSTTQAVNRKKREGAANNVIGVRSHGRKFTARFGAYGQRHYLGLFDSEEEAKLAYDVARDRFCRIGLVKYFQ